ncbi:MAG: sigma-54-dependent Fis family transcriptional regulator [Nitrospinae bacterium]|nr:sigma-54-dependent Fis family transcriptional regulator [Nitrospinota bacterium]
MSEATILLVDDDEISLVTLETTLKMNGFACLLACNGREALDMLAKNAVDLVVTDQQMPVMDGMELLKEIKARHGHIPFIMLTAFGTIDSAVLSIKEGANDYMQKPFDPPALLATIRRSLTYSRLSEENTKLKDQLNQKFSFHTIVTNSKVMRKALEDAEKVSAVPNTTVAVYGESGTGKEVLAQAIHFSGPRMADRFVAVNCASIPHNLLESELFGHVKGAFTGADRDRDGKFAYAQKGTIFLDEIGDAPLEIQGKLLRVLQERVYEKVGSNKQVKTECRVIVATNRDLKAMVKSGAFREDLFHRINSFPILLPPLRERKEDIPLLVNHFLELFRAEFGKPLPGVSGGAMERILAYPWPGNIRELKNCIERAAILSSGDEPILPRHLIINEGAAEKGGEAAEGGIRMAIDIPKERFSMDAVTDEVLRQALERCGNNKSKAAELLKVDRTIFYRRPV